MLAMRFTMLPARQNAFGIDGTAVDPELDMLGTTGVFQPVDNFHHDDPPKSG